MQNVRILGNAIVLAAAAFILGYYSIWLAWEDLRRWPLYKASFTRTLGLEENDDVLVSGFLVGRVRQVKLEGDHHLVIFELDPSVTLRKEGIVVEIRTMDAFGTAVLEIVPGKPQSVAWPRDVTIPGTLKTGVLDIPTESSSQRALTDTIKEWEDATTGLTRTEGGTIGKLLNDPDLASDFREAFRTTRAGTENFRDLTTTIAQGEGPGALIRGSPEDDIRSSVGRVREDLGLIREAMTEAAHGEGGTAGRLLGDTGTGDATRAAVKDTAGIVRDYQNGEGRLAGILSGSAEAGDHLQESLARMAESTTELREGRGPFGGIFAAGGGEPARRFFADLDDRATAGLYGDGSAGVILSPDDRGRRAILGDNPDPDLQTGFRRVERVLTDMRRALVKIKAEQAPNTFAGALLSVF